jgi:triosephosphate isomerase
MKSPLVIANWKMNGCAADNEWLIENILVLFNEVDNGELVISPPSPYLVQIAELLSRSQIKLAAQNMSAFNLGAHTGEVSSAMLNDFGCEYVLLGHSERRIIYHENNHLIALKFAAACSAGITPVLCVGETLKQYQCNETLAVILTQIDAVLAEVGIQAFDKAVIAYEPVWAIGTGETATPEQAQHIHLQIRTQLAKHDVNIANKIAIIYGGSLNTKNAQALFSQNDIDGGLVGGASLEAEAFIQIYQAAINSQTT